MTLPRLILPDSEKETVEAGVLGVGLWKKLVATLKLLGGGSRKQVIEHDGYEVTVEASHQHGQDSGRVRVEGGGYVIVGGAAYHEDYLAPATLAPVRRIRIYPRDEHGKSRWIYLVAGGRIVADSTYRPPENDKQAALQVIIWKPEGSRVGVELGLNEAWWAKRETLNIHIAKSESEYVLVLQDYGSEGYKKRLIKYPGAELVEVDYGSQSATYRWMIDFLHSDLSAHLNANGAGYLEMVLLDVDGEVKIRVTGILPSTLDYPPSPRFAELSLGFLQEAWYLGFYQYADAFRFASWSNEGDCLRALAFVGVMRGIHPDLTAYPIIVFVGVELHRGSDRVFLYRWPEQEPFGYSNDPLFYFSSSSIDASTLDAQGLPFFSARVQLENLDYQSEEKTQLRYRIGDVERVVSLLDGETLQHDVGGIKCSRFGSYAWRVVIYTTTGNVKLIVCVRLISGSLVDVSSRFSIDSTSIFRFIRRGWSGLSELVIMLDPNFRPHQANSQRGVFSINTLSGNVTRIGTAAPNNKITSDNKATIAEAGTGCAVLFSDNGEDSDPLRLWYCGREIELRWVDTHPPLLAGDINITRCRFYEKTNGGFFVAVGQNLWLSIRIAADKEGRYAGLAKYNPTPPTPWGDLA